MVFYMKIDEIDPAVSEEKSFEKVDDADGSMSIPYVPLEPLVS